MAWEKRRSAGRYYYRSRRNPDGAVVKVYLGRGPRADQAAHADTALRAQRDADRRAVLAEQAALASLEATMTEVRAAAEVLAAAHLVANGFHRTNYGPWRRRRDC
jgi:hypothetical protein